MKKHKKHIILYPLSFLYGLVTGFRNWLFDQDLLPTTSFHIPIISIGNLAVGGTGKTPHTEFILSILQHDRKIAVLSRGYKRQTKGFYLADEKSDNSILGDEQFQIHQKFPNVAIAVDEKRVHGVQKLIELLPNLQLVLLDDAFQHRYVEPGLSILLTDYSNLYCNDLVMPAGELREWKIGSKRAGIIIVTKCPTDLKPIDMRVVESQLKIESNQKIFFSTYQYEDIVPVFPDSTPENWNFNSIKEKDVGIILVAGIVSPEPIIEQMKQYSDNIKPIFYEDHHYFQPKDFRFINKHLKNLPNSEKIILITEKDAARLVTNQNFPEELKSKTFALPIKVSILHNQETSFIQIIKDYVEKNTRNS
ncbi:MAG: tetraacyldisaccharide 4'-kinase [Paludibacter sp.]